MVGGLITSLFASVDVGEQQFYMRIIGYNELYKDVYEVLKYRCKHFWFLRGNLFVIINIY